MLQQKLSQKLLQKLSPQQIQLIKLLQLNTLNFEQRLEEELIDNPALESGRDEDEFDDNLEKSDNEGDDIYDSDDFDDYGDEYGADAQDKEIDLSDYLNDGDEGGIQLNDYNQDDEEKEGVPVIFTKSFRDEMTDQASTVVNGAHEMDLAEQIIGTLDDDGYLRRPLKSIAADLLFTRNIRTSEEELEQVLKKVQQLDPPGVAARDLQECLLLQIARKEERGHNPIIKLARVIIANHMEDFSKKHYDRLLKKLDVHEDYLREALDLIVHLNPKPAGSESGAQKTEYIIPDFTVTEQYGELEVSLNGRNTPELRVSRSYMETLKGYEKNPNASKKLKESVQFIKQKLDGAKWFIEAVKQRQNTLVGTMRTIVALQRDFFLSGDETDLKPMILKDVADRVGLDISTISRVANSKYVDTDFGIFPLKYFFSEGVTTESGEEVSNREIKSILKDAIEKENKNKPLTDEKLMTLLKEKGYNIARRTVAKYREQMNIPVARLRKEL